MDSAFWFTWYDVREDSRAEYLGWLHERYIPAVLKRDGVLWGVHYQCTESLSASAPGRFKFTENPAVPGGTRYILVFAASESKVFLDPTEAEFHDSLTGSDRAMLSLREGARSSILVEEARVEGADADLHPGPAPCIQLGSFDVSPEFEDDACAWFARQRMPSMEGTPGAVRMRTMVAVSGWARHACLYEFTSAEARSFYVARERAQVHKQAWTDQVAGRLVHMPGSPAVAKRIWPVEAQPVRTEPLARPAKQEMQQ